MDIPANGAGVWLRFCLGVTVMAALGSLTFVVQLKVDAAAMVERQRNYEQRSDEQRQQMHEEMLYRFDQIDRELRTQRSKAAAAPERSRTPVFPDGVK